MSGGCHLCGARPSYHCPEHNCKKAYCAKCLEEDCPRVDEGIAKTRRFTCDCCLGFCPKCHSEAAKTAQDTCRRLRELFDQVQGATVLHIQKRHKEIASLLKQQGLDKEQTALSKEDDDARWPKEVTLPAVNSIPAYKFYGMVSQCVTAEDKAVFQYCPYVGDMPDKAWIDELKQLYDSGEKTSEHDLTFEEDLVFKNLLPEMKTDEELQFYCKVFAHLTKKPQAVVLKWQDEHHPKKPDQELVLDNSLLFCQSRECWHYCCSTHDESIQPPEAPVYPKPQPVARKQAAPCGPHCFRHLGTASERALSPMQWTEKDKKLIARLVQQFGDDLCLIGVLLQKPCAQLHTLMPSLPKLEGTAPEPITERMRKKRRALAQAHSVSAAEQQHSFAPCKHAGACAPGTCSCRDRKSFCEKSCGCGDGCANRFPGCQCAATIARACVRESCLCWANYRECDPDLCNNCTAHLVNVPQGQRVCYNVSMQNGYHKICFIGESKLHGNGLFIGERAEKNDYIFEYTGEVISQSEGERRGTYYDKMGHSFLFNLTGEYVVDATEKGNRTRFANHSKQPNITVWCNGSFKIGFYAFRNIEPGEELLLDYHYQEKFEQYVSIPDPKTKKGK